MCELQEDHVSLSSSEPERADSSLSSHSSFMEDTIQWKKGNVLGKGAFGTVSRYNSVTSLLLAFGEIFVYN